MPQPYKVFTIYAREDAAYLEELRGQLRPLEIAGRIKVWSDREINPGVDWEMEIVHNLDTADIILILVSGAYYNSEYIHEKELKYAFERHDEGLAKVLPIIVRPCSFGDDPGISRLQVLPTDGKPVTDSQLWPERDKAWVDVVAGVKRTLDVMVEAENRSKQALKNVAARRLAEVARKKETEERARQAEVDKRAREAATAKAREEQAKLVEQQRAQQAAYQQADRTAWQQASEAHHIEAYQGYIAQFPQGEMVKEAQARIKDLKKRQQPAPWRIYVDYGSGIVILLLLSWIGIKMFESNRESQVSNESVSTATFSLNYPMEQVEGGTFQMGSPTTEEGRDENECQHSVSVKSFYIGRYEVTQAQWKAVMGNNPSNFNECENCPVEKVSWDNVQAFIETLNRKTGKTYRLPSEAEWEYAARGGNKSKGYLYAGSNDLNSVAWYVDNANSNTHPVGTKAPNELELYDMSGNVWEWCQDLYKAYSNCKATSSESRFRVYRGGGWNYDARKCRTTDRDCFEPSGHYHFLGFRLAASSL